MATIKNRLTKVYATSGDALARDSLAAIVDLHSTLTEVVPLVPRTEATRPVLRRAATTLRKYRR